MIQATQAYVVITQVIVDYYLHYLYYPSSIWVHYDQDTIPQAAEFVIREYEGEEWPK